MDEHADLDDREQVGRIVSRTFPDASVTRLEDRSGMAHRTVVAHLSDAPHDRVVARWLVHDHLRDRFEREVTVLDRMADATDIPVPRVLGHDHAAEPPHTLMTFLPGDSRENRFHEPHRLSSDELRSAGEMLARIHETTLDIPSFRGFTGDWNEVLHGIVDRHIAQLDGYPFDDLIPALRDAVETGLADIDADATTLLHHDFRPANLLFQDGAVTGVVDWERAMHGDPLYDIVKAELNFAGVHATPEDIPAAFREGYTTVREMERDADREQVYRLMHTIEVLWAYPIWRKRFPWPDRGGVKNRLRDTVERRIALP